MTEKPNSQFHRNSQHGFQGRCKACQLAYQNANRVHAKPVPMSCRQCGKEFLASPYKGEPMYCSPPCKVRGWKEKNRERRKAINKKHESLKRGASTGEVVNRMEVFDRCGWICGICGLPVDPSIPPRAPYSASLDHIVPLSRGGLHEASNLQLAHFRCNASKKNRVSL